MSPHLCLFTVLQGSEADPAASGGHPVGLDIACLVIVLVSAFLGARRGTWWQFVRFLGIIATLSVARVIPSALDPIAAGRASSEVQAAEPKHP